MEAVDKRRLLRCEALKESSDATEPGEDMGDAIKLKFKVPLVTVVSLLFADASFVNTERLELVNAVMPSLCRDTLGGSNNDEEVSCDSVSVDVLSSFKNIGFICVGVVSRTRIDNGAGCKDEAREGSSLLLLLMLLMLLWLVVILVVVVVVVYLALVP